MNDQKNMLLAIVLSAIVLIGWQYFVGMPQMEKQRQQQQAQQQAQKQAAAAGRDARTRHARDARHPGGTRHAGRQPGAPQTGAPTSPTGQVLHARNRARREPAHRRRDAAGEGLDRAQRRAPRRPRADAVPRDGRSEIARDRAAVAARHRASVLRRVRLGAGRGHDREAADRRNRVASGRRGRADAGQAGHARPGTTARAWNSAAPSRSTTSTCSPRRTR